jgi:hypothetical protein
VTTLVKRMGHHMRVLEIKKEGIKENKNVGVVMATLKNQTSEKKTLEKSLKYQEKKRLKRVRRMGIEKSQLSLSMRT